jgi:uncharacterized protein
MTDTLKNKYENLLANISSLERVAVAFSSGVDSAFLLYAAKQALPDSVVAITATSPFFPKRETTEAIDFCKKYDIKHILVKVSEKEIDHFTENPPDRCYYCKTHLFNSILKTAADEGVTTIVEGSNVDDLGDYRPGLKALAELEIKSPLREAGLTKKEIRELSRDFGLSTFDKPSFACLASRIPYGEEITSHKLSMVEDAENLLLKEGFKQFRVRVHGNSNLTARIELLPDDFPRMLDETFRNSIYNRFKELGFAYTSLDLKGYRTGSLNETLA